MCQGGACIFSAGLPYVDHADGVTHKVEALEMIIADLQQATAAGSPVRGNTAMMARMLASADEDQAMAIRGK